MASPSLSLLLFFTVAVAAAAPLPNGQTTVAANQTSVPLNRTHFPSGFVFGTASSAYQYEGAANKDGRGPSIWDTFSRLPGKIADGSTGVVATDFYHSYKEDIKMMKEIGLYSFRFSISWSRILPKGKLSGGINPDGVRFYNNLINELLANGIKPLVTLFHWDLPQTLEDEYLGFLSSKIIKDYKDYADLCFKLFGDRVKQWITFNEPSTFTIFGYHFGTLAPGRCSTHCTAGDSGTEPYIVSHNILLCHAHAVNIYRQKYKGIQKGEIGITLVSHYFIPLTNSKADNRATERAFDFGFGWYMNPITNGKYPKIMRAVVKERLPKFTKPEANLIKGSIDFLGLNYYTTHYVYHLQTNKTSYKNVNVSDSPDKPSYKTDIGVGFTVLKNGVLLGPLTGMYGLIVYPKGIEEILMYVKTRYNHPTIYITENGFAQANVTLSSKEALKDETRVQFLDGHLRYLLKAIKKGVNVKGYYAWSFLDNFEWQQGYKIRFGLVFVDFKDNLKRFYKDSALWFKQFLLH